MHALYVIEDKKKRENLSFFLKRARNRNFQELKKGKFFKTSIYSFQVKVKKNPKKTKVIDKIKAQNEKR